MYYALKLTDDSRTKLLSLINDNFFLPEGWKLYLDHITLIHENNVTPEVWNAVSQILDNFVCPRCEFSVTGYAKNDAVWAFRVDALTMNHTAHITVATAPGHNPVESNEIKDEDWTEVWCTDKFVGYLVCNP